MPHISIALLARSLLTISQRAKYKHKLDANRLSRLLKHRYLPRYMLDYTLDCNDVEFHSASVAVACTSLFHFHTLCVFLFPFTPLPLTFPLNGWYFCIHCFCRILQKESFSSSLSSTTDYRWSTNQSPSIFHLMIVITSHHASSRCTNTNFRKSDSSRSNRRDETLHHMQRRCSSSFIHRASKERHKTDASGDT